VATYRWAAGRRVTVGKTNDGVARTDGHVIYDFPTRRTGEGNWPRSPTCALFGQRVSKKEHPYPGVDRPEQASVITELGSSSATLRPVAHREFGGIPCGPLQINFHERERR